MTIFNKKTIRQKLLEDYDYSNVMAVPAFSKVTLNMGVGEAVANKKVVDSAAAELELISGQKVVVTRARKSIAGFKIRDGWPIGCKVTLRRDRMYEFLERLITVAIPRTRDFRGYNKKSFDGRGNYSFGITEQIIFPEIDYDKIDQVRGLDVCITTTARTDEDAQRLLKLVQFPIKY